MATVISLTPEAERRLEILESRTGRSKGFYIDEIVERGLDDIEDYYLAHQVPERVKRGEERPPRISSPERPWLGRLSLPVTDVQARVREVDLRALVRLPVSRLYGLPPLGLPPYFELCRE